MRRVVYAVAVLTFLLSAASSSGQSLVEVAKKEKERRAKNGKHGQVRLIEEDELRNAKGNSFSTTGESSSGSTSPASSPSDTPPPPRATAGATAASRSAEGATTTDELSEKRRKCEEDLRAAETERKQLQTLFDQGAGTSVSCRDALNAPAEHPAEATECADLKRRMDTAEARMRQALDCIRGK